MITRPNAADNRPKRPAVRAGSRQARASCHTRPCPLPGPGCASDEPSPCRAGRRPPPGRVYGPTALSPVTSEHSSSPQARTLFTGGWPPGPDLGRFRPAEATFNPFPATPPVNTQPTSRLFPSSPHRRLKRLSLCDNRPIHQRFCQASKKYEILWEWGGNANTPGGALPGVAVTRCVGLSLGRTTSSGGDHLSVALDDRVTAPGIGPRPTCPDWKTSRAAFCRPGISVASL
jgi:hypothetical protein